MSDVHSPRAARRSRLRVLLGGVLLASVGVLGAAIWVPEAASWWRAGREAPQQPASPSGPQALLAVAPADLPEAVRDRYRLRPDRRLLLAVAAVHRLRTGAAPEVTAEFQNGRWRILAGGGEVGVLSELPSFEEGTEMLTRLAARLPLAVKASRASGAGGTVPEAGGAVPELDRAVREVDAAALLAALSSLDGSPADAQRDAARVLSITSGLAWLSTLTVDHLEQGDALLAETWAWLAVERASVGPRGAASETLTARALGYEAAAGRAAAALAGDDPVRLYAAGDAAGLDTLCAQRLADRPCHFLRLALMAERRQDERFRSALPASPFRDEKSLALRGLETRLYDFDGGSAGGDLAELAMRSLLDSDEGSAEGRTRDFEAAVGRLGSGRDAGPVGTAAIQAAHRAAFYSGLSDEARFAIDQYTSGPAARELAASLGEPAEGTAEELRRWIEVRAQVLDGATDMRPLAGLMESSRSIGAAPLFDLGFLISRHVVSTDPLRRAPIPALFARMDTRPSHRVMAARVARGNLTSALLYEKLAQAAAEAAPHLSEELPALAAELREDAVRLREIADDPAMPSYAQIVALHALAALGKADDAFVRARFEAVAEDPDEGIDTLVDFLEKRDDLAGALAAVEAAIQRSQGQDALTRAYLQTAKARLLLQMGEPDRAFAAIEPALATYREDTLLQAARIELARRRPESALKLAQGALERYPDRSSETSGLIARARWQLGDGELAAKELAASRNGIVGPWNRHLPEAFAEAFATAPEDQARQAFAELQAAGIAHHVLARVAVALGQERGLDVALPLLEGLRDPAPEWQDQIRFITYDLIKEKADDDAALAWVRKAVPDRSHNFAMTLYQARRYDLLLGLFPSGEEGTNPLLVRMLKAASHLHLQETTGPRWEGLVAAVEQETSDDFFAHFARYLVGRADTAKILRPAPDANYLASLGWVMGVKAASERRFADADGWFQVALESGQHLLPPHAWSWVIESDWIQAERSLERLAKKGELVARPEVEAR